MAGEIDIYLPEVNPVDAQAARNRELDNGAIAKVVEHFVAAYSETHAIAADFWPRQGAKGVGLLQRFGLWKATILAWYGDQLPENLAWIATAGDTLAPHQDGTVTVGS